MLSKLPSRQSCLNWFGMTKALMPLTLGVVLLTSVEMPAEAQVIMQQSSPTTHVIGSPIPSPVPVVPGTSYPYSLSPYNSTTYNSNSYYNPYYNPYGYYDYNQTIVTPGRQVIRNSTLINPTVINSRITDSVLVDPVIVNSPGYPRRVFRQPPAIYNSPYYFNRPGIRVRIGY
jgi:hypothetical protein